MSIFHSTGGQCAKATVQASGPKADHVRVGAKAHVEAEAVEPETAGGAARAPWFQGMKVILGAGRRQHRGETEMPSGPKFSWFLETSH
jgi:hypothetical protein